LIIAPVHAKNTDKALKSTTHKTSSMNFKLPDVKTISLSFSFHSACIQQEKGNFASNQNEKAERRRKNESFQLEMCQN